MHRNWNCDEKLKYKTINEQKRRLAKYIQIDKLEHDKESDGEGENETINQKLCARIETVLGKEMEIHV